MTTYYVMMMAIFGAFDQQILAGKFPTLTESLPKPPTTDSRIHIAGETQQEVFENPCEYAGETAQG